MSSRGDASVAARTVFVGNISYDTTEEQLMEVFSQAGPVASFRMKFDRETGKPKGFGFAEYHDVESAASARRNLNNYELNGRRLRVDSATGSTDKGGAAPLQAGAAPGVAKRQRTGFPGAPQSATEQVSGLVSSMTPAQVYQIAASIKEMADKDPESARGLLASNPQLAYAVLQAQVLLGMAPQLVAAAQQRKLLDAQQSHMQRLQQQQLQQQLQQQQQQQQFHAIPSQAIVEAAFAALPPEHRDLLVNVLSMTEDQISFLPVADQQQTLALRAQALELLRTASGQ